MRAKLLLLSVLIVLSIVLPARAEDPPSITTWGKATVYVVPDRAVISVSVHTSDLEYAKAVGENRANAAKLLAALKAIGIAEKDIESGYVSMNSLWGFNGGFGGSFSAINGDKGFHIYRSYSITLTDLKLIDKTLDTAMANGANESQGVSLETSELRRYRDQARQQAIRAARDKAVLLAKELESTVGKPKVITETNANSYASSGGITGSGFMAGPPEEPEPSPVFMVGKIPVEAAVRVTFELK